MLLTLYLMSLEEMKGTGDYMNNLKKLELKLLNLDIVTINDKDTDKDVELMHIQGIIPMTDYEKNNYLCGEYKCIDIWSACCDELEEICHTCKDIDKIVFSGYYNEKRKFKIVTVDEIIKKKK